MSLPVKSPLYDQYWHFAYLRQEAFVNRFIRQKSEITDDDILKTYKFTNCYRSCDRVSQFLIQNVIRLDSFTKEDTFFRILLFKLFNKIDTWTFLESQLGEISLKSFDINRLDSLISSYMNEGNKAYSAAYIMPSGKREFGFDKKHLNNLHLLKLMLKKNLHKKIWEFTSLEEIYNTFIDLPTLGPFLAFQFSIDIAYSSHSNVSESDFVVAGPGAIRGMKKCFDDNRGWSSQDIIRYMTDIQEEEFSRLNLDFKYLENRKLQLIDCQNLFCEVDKYSRVKFPDVVIGNTRIKQRYRPKDENIQFNFPPKWNTSLPKLSSS